MSRTLVIGFGNRDRADDGVAYYVVNALRGRLGQRALGEDETGLEELGAPVDSIFLSQIVPELMDVVTPYRQIVFVDAHVGEERGDLYCAPVLPEDVSAAFTHQMSPTMFLALLKILYQQEPEGHIVSIRGYDFDFHPTLSPATSQLIDEAVDCIEQLHGRLTEEPRPS
jgi:hydrogenase maturation protease